MILTQGVHEDRMGVTGWYAEKVDWVKQRVEHRRGKKGLAQWVRFVVITDFDT